MVRDGIVTAEEALSYAMSLPVATVVSGMESFDVLRQNLNVARGFTPMGDEEMRLLRERCAEMAGDGRFEHFKTTAKFDGPVGRQQHGFPPPNELNM
jgi:uncharacterized protein